MRGNDHIKLLNDKVVKSSVYNVILICKITTKETMFCNTCLCRSYVLRKIANILQELILTRASSTLGLFVDFFTRTTHTNNAAYCG